MKQLLADPILALAIVSLRDSELPQDAPSHSDAITSVRILSYKSGWHEAINTLLSLGEPLPVEVPEEEPTYGIDRSKFQTQPV